MSYTHKPNFRSKTRLSMPHHPLKQLEPIRVSHLAVIGPDQRKSVDQKPSYSLNLNAISAMEIKK